MAFWVRPINGMFGAKLAISDKSPATNTEKMYKWSGVLPLHYITICWLSTLLQMSLKSKSFQFTNQHWWNRPRLMSLPICQDYNITISWYRYYLWIYDKLSSLSLVRVTNDFQNKAWSHLNCNQQHLKLIEYRYIFVGSQYIVNDEQKWPQLSNIVTESAYLAMLIVSLLTNDC